MGRFIFSQLRFRPSRTATLGAGILVAAASFVLLTSAVSTSALQVKGTVAKNWKTAYDILVRPTGSFTSIEQEQGLVADNYLSGIFGGITLKQWHRILLIPGVEVAAPIANLGYVIPTVRVQIPITQYLDNEPFQLYRLRSSWLAANRQSRYPGFTSYVYYSRDHTFRYSLSNYIEEELPDGAPAQVCSGFPAGLPAEPQTPFASSDPRVSLLSCFSGKTPSPDEGLPANGGVYNGYTGPGVGSIDDAQFPFLLAAVDPVQEQRLVDLGESIVAGRMLQEGQRPAYPYQGADVPWLPVIVGNGTFVDQSLEVQVQRLEIPAGTNLPRTLTSRKAFRFVTSLTGHAAGRESFAPSQMYQSLLNALATNSSRSKNPQPVTSYIWQLSPTTYRIIGNDRLGAVPVVNPDVVWTVRPGDFFGQSFLEAPPGNQDVQFRSMHEHIRDGGVGLDIVGRFDPQKLLGFSPLSEVPLESYYPPIAAPADEASRSALGDKPLLPTLNLGDYVAQPPFMITTLEAAVSFLTDHVKRESPIAHLSPKAPISVIRVRVAGVTGPDPVSRERVRRVAQAIRDQTGLAVDITAGSSPHPLLVQVPAGKYGRPALTVREGWTKKGVAFAIVSALDRKSLALFGLVLVVCGLFTGNGALAAVRSRRREIGTLVLLGWRRGRIFQAVLGELVLVGLLAGVAGTAIAAGLVGTFGLKISLAKTLLVAPVAVVLALLAGAIPAWRAARAVPLDAVRPPINEPRRGRPHRGLLGMALANLTRVPGRTLLGAGALLVGVGALAFLVAVNLAFKGTVVGTLLGNVVSVQVRAVDWLSVALAIGLGALSVADVVVLNLKERAPELVTLRTTGWTQAHLGRLVAYEGLGIGVAGSVAGALLGLGLAAQVGGIGPKVILAALLAAVVGVAAAALASAVPVLLVGRMTPPEVLAEE